MQLEGATYVAIAEINVPRASRQRREIEIESDGLRASVAERGVLSPLLLRREGMELVFGERRLTAASANGHSHVPVVFLENLSPQEARIIELEENLRRAELPWRDEVSAIASIHAAYSELALSRGDKWSISHTVRSLNYSQVAECLRVAEALDSPRIKDMTSVRAAYNVLSRGDSRAIADMMNDLTDAGREIFESLAPTAVPGGGEAAIEGSGPLSALSGATAASGAPLPQRPAVAPQAAPQASPLLQADFIEWSATYVGPRFNFVHCDFPYGKGVFAGPQSGVQKWREADGSDAYDDSEQVYWKLIEALCTNLDRIMAPSAHLMFWLENDCETQARTIAKFRQLAPGLVFNTTPLVWWKTDNVGVLADPKRGPRNVYETALVASREDRLIVRAVSNAYGAPTAKRSGEAVHPSEKPEPVLRHFFQMFVDENTRLLDPTCGGGAALRAAESMGAKDVLGVERSSEWFTAAVSAMRTFRNLRRAAG